MTNEPTRTIRARIPVLVDERGYWTCADYSWVKGQPDWSMLEEMLIEADDDTQPGNLRRVFVEVDLPVPEAEDVVLQGTVCADNCTARDETAV